MSPTLAFNGLAFCGQRVDGEGEQRRGLVEERIRVAPQTEAPRRSTSDGWRRKGGVEQGGALVDLHNIGTLRSERRRQRGTTRRGQRELVRVWNPNHSLTTPPPLLVALGQARSGHPVRGLHCRQVGHILTGSLGHLRELPRQ
jgi:hypothetical protein